RETALPQTIKPPERVIKTFPERPFQTTGSPSSRNPIRTSTWKAGSPALFTDPRILLTSNQSMFRIVWRALIIALRTACWTLSSDTPTTSIILYVLSGIGLSLHGAHRLRDAPAFGCFALYPEYLPAIRAG